MPFVVVVLVVASVLTPPDGVAANANIGPSSGVLPAPRQQGQREAHQQEMARRSGHRGDSGASPAIAFAYFFT